MLRNLTLRNWYGFCHYASMQHTLMPHPSSMAYSSVISDDDPANNSYKRQPYVDEKDILNELSDLLAVPQGIPVPYLFKVSHATTSTPQPRAVDMFLSPEEKLRGVFLQKLKGRTAIECALNNAGIDLTEDIIARVVNKGNLGGEAMVIFFRWAIRHPSIKQDTDCYNLIIKALGRRKYFDYMEKMLCEMGSNGIRPSLVTLSIVLDSFLRARHVSKAIEFFGRLGGFGWEPNTETLNVLLQCLCQRFHVGAANRFLNSVKDRIPFNATTYNTIISGWSKSGRVGEIKRVLEGMSADGFSPDFFTFSYLIEGFGRAGQIDEAVEIFSGVKEKCCGVDVSVYNAIITNFAMVGDFDSCMTYYKNMLSEKCDPNVDTYTNLISAFLKARKVADALEMFDEMLSRELVPSTGIITSFVEPLCSYGPPYAAMMIYKKAKKAGCKISLTAYKSLLMRLSRFGKCGMMLNLWEEMQESGHSSDIEVYEYIINGLCNIGQLDNAVLVMDESLRKGFCPSRLIWSKLNNKLMASNQVEKAYKLFLKIKDARRHENARRYWRANGWHF
ncbi:putative pentatricopeptide repeat-containing protein At5g43820 [Punica granatum]|uniref:Pentatricopeptide repeat-containing protein At5g43820 n=2 Tax=Punica granatum TaxID=22663 RepID=A0A218WEE1_PUNGR|nr:putative pentatricopeptide repeat-containing protein At5g43820 [Punica granatum]OWM70571.1 hypothetical protein CDL15_Pgr014244 [Punica granatum]